MLPDLFVILVITWPNRPPYMVLLQKNNYGSPGVYDNASPHKLAHARLEFLDNALKNRDLQKFKHALIQTHT